MSRSTPKTSSTSSHQLSVRLDRATFLALRQFGAHYGLTNAETGLRAILQLLDASTSEAPNRPQASPSPVTNTSNHNSRPDTSHD